MRPACFICFAFISLLVSPWLTPYRADAGEIKTVDRLEAAVNSSLILNSDLRRFRTSLVLRSQIDPLFSNSPLSGALKNKGSLTDEEILNFLIEEKIILSEFQIKDSEVEQEINSIQSTNKLSRESLVAAIKSQGFSFDDYFELIRISIAKRSVIERDIRTKVHITDDDIKNHYYNQGRSKSGAANVLYQVQMITVDPKRFTTKSDAKKAITAAAAELSSGVPFVNVSKKYSDHPNAENGGDMGFLSLTEMSGEIRKHVEKLRPGQVSSVFGGVNTKYALLRVSDIKSTDTADFEKAKEQILNELSATEYQQQLGLWLDRQKAKSFILKHGQGSIPSQNVRKN
jgi:peptidyl-prolyl cis-trans isomerase SurA